MLKIARFLREYARRGSAPVRRLETRYHREGEDLDASVYALSDRQRRPGWVVLHGLTATGKEHPSLDRFCRALAATDAIVMVPDIPEWRDLRVATAAARVGLPAVNRRACPQGAAGPAAGHRPAPARRAGCPGSA